MWIWKHIIHVIFENVCYTTRVSRKRNDKGGGEGWALVRDGCLVRIHQGVKQNNRIIINRPSEF